MNAPVTEAELQAWVDACLAPARRAAVDAYLAQHPAEAARLQAYRDLNVALRVRYNPVLDAAVPAALLRPPPLPHPRQLWQRLLGQSDHLPHGAASAGAGRPPAANDVLLATVRGATALLLVLAGGSAGWLLRGASDAPPTAAATTRLASAVTVPASPTAPAAGQLPQLSAAAGTSLAHHAAVAHAVYTPEQKHPVEVAADQQAHLVAWLSKRLGAPLHAPQLETLGYALEGGRLLPGSSGPVAQFMYRDAHGSRLTLYVSTEQRGLQQSGFRYSQEGALSVFYWIDGPFGYALSGALPRAALGQIANAVYAQLLPAP
ncbi:MAG: anti-sigma factor [Sphingomonadaceae bacterium]